jgi:HSP20 family protein
MSSETTMKTETPPHAVDTERTRSGQTYRPNVDILEHQDELVILADMPGVDSADLDVRFEDGELSIRAPVPVRQPEGTRYLLREYGVGDFYRSFRVSEQIDASRIAAEYADGVLKLRLPKVEAAKPRKIAVTAR